ncbi:hypothetical protein [Qipengyuania zhejiangensis]|uniref:hypothetical protein n=1 Tax=Qipengyuania zhejiangensis TaxID=3077782 RepID=UPI002D792BF0|nr:hypothetical protein [Qipengyuania sp. Z2]
MKPKSIRRFEYLFWISVILSLVSTALAWANLSDQAEAAIAMSKGNSPGMGVILLLSSVAIFLTIALVVWAAISQYRIGAVRWVLLALVVYSAIEIVRTGALANPIPSSVADALATVVAGASTLFLFTAEARDWFRGDSGQVTDSL